MLLEVITFDPTFGILISLGFRKLEIQSFSETPRLPQFEFGKTSKCAFKVKTEKVQQICRCHDEISSGPTRCAKGYKQPLAPQIGSELKNWVLGSCLSVFWVFFFSLFSPYFSPNKHKNTSKLLDSSLFFKNTRQCSYPPSSSPLFHTLDLRFVRVK